MLLGSSELQNTLGFILIKVGNTLIQIVNFQSKSFHNLYNAHEIKNKKVILLTYPSLIDKYISDVDGSWISGGRRLSGSPSPGGLGPSSPVSMRMEPGGRGYDDGAHLQKEIQSKHEYKWEYMHSCLYNVHNFMGA